MDKKVGIVSCYFKYNYGSMLQAYATQKFLDDNNIPNETINISDLADFKKGKKKYYMSQITNFGFIKTKLGMIKLKIYQKTNKELGKNFKIRNKEFKKFERVFNITRTFNTYNDIKEYSLKNYSDVVVGSDQLWLPVNVVADYYTLNWVPDEVNKISFATSFGVSKVPDKYKKQYSDFLKRINYISVREANAVGLVKELSDREAKLVCDPTVLLNKEQWMDIQKEERLVDEKYIFCYFLGSNIEHRKFVERLKEKTGYKIVSLNHCDEYVKYSDKFADIIPYNVGPAEFVNYIRNAEYVCTDSFHGTVFSLINNTKFYTFERFSKNSKMSTNSRIHSLLKIVKMEDRLISGTEDVNIIQNEINFTEANKAIENLREESIKWFLNSIKYEKSIDNEKYINIQNKEMCTGCTACKSICPKDAIEMVGDEEGFLYPHVNKEKCINCGLCKNTCPMVNKKNYSEHKLKAYIFQHKDDYIRKESTSGGAFTAMAEKILEDNGVVFGVTFDDEYKVKHAYVTKKDELYKFQNSKYVQSNPDTTFSRVKEFLDTGKKVLYSGTSCQIEGLRKFLKKDYENLYLLDVVCRAVPSPKLWDKYLKLRVKKYKNPKKIFFREKYFGYKYSNLSIYAENNEYHSGIDSDPYLRAFFSNICDRPSCYSCKFKTQYRNSDLTIWDCFNVENFNKKLDDDKGTTRILVHSEKGKKLMEQISKDNICEEIDVEKALSDFNGIFSTVKFNNKKEQFVKDMNELDEEKLFAKYFPDTLKVKIERNSRKILLKTGIYKNVLKIGKKIRKRV